MYPPKAELARVLARYRDMARTCGCNEGLGIRLQVTRAGGAMYFGELGPAATHHGAWGSDTVFPDTVGDVLDASTR